jgi:hypothetical protein
VENDADIYFVHIGKSLFFLMFSLFIFKLTAWGQVRIDRPWQRAFGEFSTPLYDKIIHTWHFFGVVLTLFPWLFWLFLSCEKDFSVFHILSLTKGCGFQPLFLGGGEKKAL